MVKQVAIGLLIPYSVFLFFYAKFGFRFETRMLLRVPPVLLFCATWSVVPNVIKGMPFYLSNIFFFNGILGRMHTTGSTWGLGAIYFVFVSLIFIFARHLGAQERKIRDLRETMEGK